MTASLYCVNENVLTWFFNVGKEFPFLYPLSSTHARPASGIGVFLPICYRHSLRISYIHQSDLPTKYSRNALKSIKYTYLMTQSPRPGRKYKEYFSRRPPRPEGKYSNIFPTSRGDYYYFHEEITAILAYFR